jgi:hypothetical protein
VSPRQEKGNPLLESLFSQTGDGSKSALPSNNLPHNSLQTLAKLGNDTVAIKNIPA